MLCCLNNYDYGINSCALLPLDDTNQERAGNYLSTYTTKESNLGYNKKRFMRTRNLQNKEKTTLYMTDEEFEKFLSSSGVVEFRDKDNLTIYRNFNLEKTHGITTVPKRLHR